MCAGLKASLLGAIPYSAVRLGSYDGLKWAYKKVSTPSEAILTDMPYAPACSLSNQRGEGLTHPNPSAGSSRQHAQLLGLPIALQVCRCTTLMVFVTGAAHKQGVCPGAHDYDVWGRLLRVASSSASFPLEIVRRRAMMGTLPAGSGLHPVS